MRVLTRVIAAVVTVAFVLLAIPFILLTGSLALSGFAHGGSTLLILILYVAVLLAIVVFWVRQFRPVRGGSPTAPAESAMLSRRQRHR